MLHGIRISTVFCHVSRPSKLYFQRWQDIPLCARSRLLVSPVEGTEWKVSARASASRQKCSAIAEIFLPRTLVMQEEHPLKPPDQAYLQGLEPGQMPRGQGRSDFIDAVSVAADILNKAVELRPELEKHNVTKEIVLISSLQERVKEAEVHEFVAALVESLKEHDVRNTTPPSSQMHRA